MLGFKSGLLRSTLMLLGFLLVSLSSVSVLADTALAAVDSGSQIGAWIDIASKVVAVSAAVAAVAPVPQKVTGTIGFLRRVVDFLALNVGNAKNKSQ